MGDCGCRKARTVDPLVRQQIAEERRAALAANRAMAAKSKADANNLRQERLEAATRRR